MDSLGSLLGGKGSVPGLRDILSAGAIAAKWSELVGARVACKTAPLRLKNKILLVRTPSPTWSHQLALFKPTILQKLNEAGFEVEDIRFLFRDDERQTQARKTEIKVSAPDYSMVPRSIDSEHLKTAIASYLGAREKNEK